MIQEALRRCDVMVFELSLPKAPLALNGEIDDLRGAPMHRFSIGGRPA